METSITIPLRVRYAECDPMGFAHHSRYAIWFEMARTELLRSHGLSYADMERTGTFVVAASLEVAFKRPAHYDDLLEISATLDRVDMVRIRHSYEIRREGQLLATGTTVLACIDRAGRVQRVPDFLRPEGKKDRSRQ